MNEAGIFELLATPAPSMPAREAEALIAREFGIEGTAKPLASERDQNFHLASTHGREFVLKIANPAEDPAVTDLQTRALMHIAEHAPDIPVQRIVRTRDGQTDVSIDAGDGRSCVVRLLTYLPGVPWSALTIEARKERPAGTPGATAIDPARRRNLAQCLARLDLALRRFFHPAAGRELLWDIKQAARLRGLLTHIQDPARRAIAGHFLDSFERHAAAGLGGLRAQVIYNDLNPSNVLVDPKRTERITGIVDFGDLVHAPLVIDVAVAAAYQLCHSDDPLDTAAGFVAAYHSVNPLEDAEIDLLFDLTTTRLLTTVVITEWRAARYPENRDYILRNNPAAWAMLERLRTCSRAAAIERFRQACAGPSPAIRAAFPHSSSEVHASLDFVRTSPADLLARRARLLGPAYRLFYEEPLHIVRGDGVWLYDADGRAYLDVYNNVPHVGHCHPRVLEALTAQAAVLNTHTRYLHETVLDYAERLTATLPDPLDTVMFTCTGSEANELALRIARAATGGRGVIVSEYAYHGNTSAIAELSAAYYPSAEGPGAHVRAVPAPDVFRRRGGDVPDVLLRGADLGEAYARFVQEAIESLARDGIKLAAFIADPLFTSDGIVEAPASYFSRAIEYVRAAGGVFIADEVQAGLGRTGRHFWGFESHGIVPDLVTMGKPMGNGHPLAAVVARAELVERFSRTTRYFNTFGGNPVSCAVGLAVLDVIEDEALQANALKVGAYLQAGLRQLADRHKIIGDVRGAGLFVGAELVRDRGTLEPATRETLRVVNDLKTRGVLTNSIGPGANVLKLRPPMVFSQANADLLLETLDGVLAAL